MKNSRVFTARQNGRMKNRKGRNGVRRKTFRLGRRTGRQRKETERKDGRQTDRQIDGQLTKNQKKIL